MSHKPSKKQFDLMKKRAEDAERELAAAVAHIKPLSEERTEWKDRAESDERALINLRSQVSELTAKVEVRDAALANAPIRMFNPPPSPPPAPTPKGY
jgi:predicted  nucleic acid-binding Zn-ribbon protein